MPTSVAQPVGCKRTPEQPSPCRPTNKFVATCNSSSRNPRCANHANRREELYVITPDGIPVTRRVHAAVLICVKTAAIMSAVLALGPLKEEDYMRLLKMV